MAFSLAITFGLRSGEAGSQQGLRVKAQAVLESPPLCGAVAQLGERRVRNAKVGSSILLRSTIFPFVFPGPRSSVDRATAS